MHTFQHISQKYMNFLLRFSHFLGYVHVIHLSPNFLSDTFSFKRNSIFLRFHHHLLHHLHPLHHSSFIIFSSYTKKTRFVPIIPSFVTDASLLKTEIHSSSSFFFVFLFKQTLRNGFLNWRRKEGPRDHTNTWRKENEFWITFRSADEEELLQHAMASRERKKSLPVYAWPANSHNYENTPDLNHFHIYYSTPPNTTHTVHTHSYGSVSARTEPNLLSPWFNGSNIIHTPNFRI